MSTYKVLQDIEAEDKLFGPLTVKQFVYAMISAAIFFIGWFIGSQAGQMIAGLGVAFIFASPFLFLAAPLGRDQPNDVWLAARLRYYFKTRIRSWDQSGVQELVTVTAPKLEEHIYTDGLSRGEVSGKLKALATTIDSRGWAVKNVAVDLSNPTAQSGERLINRSDMPQQVSELDIKPWDDVLDSNSSQVGQHFTELIQEQDKTRRQDAIASMQANTTPQPQPATASASSVAGVTHPSGPKKQIAEPLPAEEQAFLNKLHKQQENLGIGRSEESLPKIKKNDNRSPNLPNTEPQIAVADFSEEHQQTPQDNHLVSFEAVEPPEEHKVNQTIVDQFKDADDLKISTIASMAKKAEDDTFHDNDIIELH